MVVRISCQIVAKIEIKYIVSAKIELRVAVKGVYGLFQGSHHQGKTWKTWNMVEAFSRPGKIREFGKRAKIREKSGNLKIPSGKIREKIQGTTYALS